MTQQVFIRAFPAAVEQHDLSDGRKQLTGRLVPYDTVADVLDINPDGSHDIYKEGFRSGAFDGQLVNGSRNKGVLQRIGLIHRHEGGLGFLGPFTALREADDGLYGDVMVLPTKAQDVGALLEAGIDELSIEFRLRSGENTSVDDKGVRWRTSAHLDSVALEPKGAYSNAQVLQYRAEQDELAAQASQADAIARDAARRLEDERVAAEAAAEATMERKRAYTEMLGKLTTAEQRQQQLIKEYGVTRPGWEQR